MLCKKSCEKGSFSCCHFCRNEAVIVGSAAFFTPVSFACCGHPTVAAAKITSPAKKLNFYEKPKSKSSPKDAPTNFLDVIDQGGDEDEDDCIPGGIDSDHSDDDSELINVPEDPESQAMCHQHAAAVCAKTNGLFDAQMPDLGGS